jgi:hypothetical protein
MCKNVLYPCATSQTFMNPDNDNNLRRALLGCQGQGVGTVNEAKWSFTRWTWAESGVPRSNEGLPGNPIRYFFRVKVISIIFSSRPPLAVMNIS